MDERIKAPILLIAFNRPETTCVVFEYIRKAKPAKLYVALDGVRTDKLYEDIVCQEVRHIVERVDWDCEVKYKINERNLGAEITVSEAIKWMFETEEYGIILEDDTVAPMSFFLYAQEMLVKYKDDERISTVCSINKGNKAFSEDDYTFARYGNTPCFGTWKRVWDGFDLNTEIKKEHTDLKFLRNLCNSDKEACYYQQLFLRLRGLGVGNVTWDFISLYRQFINGRLSIIPRVNLSSNIGVLGLHARGETNSHYRGFDADFLVNKHPENVECNVEFDKYHFDKYINKATPLMRRVIRKIMRVLLKI